MRRIFIIFILFLMANTAYLHRVPGLLGDEGSEGENVYQLLHGESLPIVGERSYIGPLIDYIRVPYVFLFGYTALALRMLMLSASVATFFLARAVLQRLFGEDMALIVLVMFLFSPIFLLQQRIGWAITLNIFFLWLLVYALVSNWKHKWLLAGLIAGIGLSNDIIFLPTLIATILCSATAYVLSGKMRENFKTLILGSWLFLIGFVAGFGTQLAVISLMREDQGNRSEVVALFPVRLQEFLPSLPLYITGSSYVARYTGTEFSPTAISTISLALIVTACIGLFHRKRVYTLLFAGGIVIHSLVLLYMVDRFTLRYFALLSMIIWLLAGIGLAVVAQRVFPVKVLRVVPVIFACILMAWTSHTVLIPFLRTGGSLKEFSLGNRNDKASAFVDVRPLIACIRDHGIMYGATQDIYDRLLYLSRGDERIQIVDGDHKSQAAWTIAYKKVGDEFTYDDTSLCPNIPFFKVVAR